MRRKPGRVGDANGRFQSTHPVRGATTAASAISDTAKFQSTHPVRGATHLVKYMDGQTDISIHAPRAGCDSTLVRWLALEDISIHAPRAGCDLRYYGFTINRSRFQSTHPVRGATSTTIRSNRRARFQSTHPVRGATISVSRRLDVLQDFNPRTPCGVRRSRNHLRLADGNFNPRTPCGVRPLDKISADYTREFQSTHPVRGATLLVAGDFRVTHISIHAPRAGCDSWRCEGRCGQHHFNPRTPCGVRRQ